MDNIEYWYDPQHTGAVRVLDHNKRIIYGSDPKLLTWKVQFEPKDSHTLLVDFRSKEKHYSRTQITATYRNKNNELYWDDGNVWKRIRVDPRIVLHYSDIQK